MGRRTTVDRVEAVLRDPDSGVEQPVRVRLMSDSNIILDIPTYGQQWRIGGFRSGPNGGTRVQMSHRGEVTGVGSNFMRGTEESAEAKQPIFGPQRTEDEVD